MKTEKEIREQIKNFHNECENFKYMAEKTGQERFLSMAWQSNIGENILKWVVDEFEFKEESIIIKIEDLK